MSLDFEKLRPLNNQYGLGWVCKGDDFHPVEDIPYRQVEENHYKNLILDCDSYRPEPIVRAVGVMDAFSPNLNKDYLHLGHLRNYFNFVFFKRNGFRMESLFGAKLGVNKKFLHNLAELFDTFESPSLIKTDEEIFLKALLGLSVGLDVLERDPDDPSLLVIPGSELAAAKLGEDSMIEEYFYPLPDFIDSMDRSKDKVYITGTEQRDHFVQLGLGDQWVGMGHVVGEDLKKISSREGSDDYRVILNSLKEALKTQNDQLVWNVLIGFLMRNKIGSNIVFSMDNLTALGSSPGLYISYTVARIHTLYEKKKENFKMPQSLSFDTKEIWGPTLHTNWYLSESFKTLNPQWAFRNMMEIAQSLNSFYQNKSFDLWTQEERDSFKYTFSVLKIMMERFGMFFVEYVEIKNEDSELLS